MPNISGVVQRNPVSIAQSWMISELTRNLVLADTVPNKTESDSPELLVGNDYYLDIIETEKKSK